MKYADYDFYLNEYHGQLTEEEFNPEIIKSSAFIRRITFGRTDTDRLEPETVEAVKMASCAVCDVRAAEEKKLVRHEGNTVVSENNDGYSASYVQEQKNGESFEAMLHRKSYEAAEDFLLPTGLLCLEV